MPYAKNRWLAVIQVTTTANAVSRCRDVPQRIFSGPAQHRVSRTQEIRFIGEVPVRRYPSAIGSRADVRRDRGHRSLWCRFD